MTGKAAYTPAPQATQALVESLIASQEKSGGILHDDLPIDSTFWGTETVTGSGATSFLARRMVLTTGATGSSTAKRAFGGGVAAWSLGAADEGIINWSKRITLLVRFSHKDSTTNGVTRLLWGPSTSDAIQDLDDKGIGWAIKNLDLFSHVHDGTTLDENDIDGTITDDQVHVLRGVSDGAGNFATYLDGSQIEAANPGAPTGNSTGAHEGMTFSVVNGADAAAQRIVIHEVRVTVEQ